MLLAISPVFFFTLGFFCVCVLFYSVVLTMPKFADVEALNKFLEDNAFVDGFVPTKADAEQFAEL